MTDQYTNCFSLWGLHLPPLQQLTAPPDQLAVERGLSVPLLQPPLQTNYPCRIPMFLVLLLLGPKNAQISSTDNSRIVEDNSFNNGSVLGNKKCGLVKKEIFN